MDVLLIVSYCSDISDSKEVSCVKHLLPVLGSCVPYLTTEIDIRELRKVEPHHSAQTKRIEAEAGVEKTAKRQRCICW